MRLNKNMQTALKRSHRATLISVNRALKAAGCDAQLVNKGAYFQFVGGTADGWHPAAVVWINHIAGWTIEQWVAQYKAFEKEHA